MFSLDGYEKKHYAIQSKGQVIFSMRMRRKEWMNKEIAHSPIFIPDPYRIKGCWHTVFSKDGPLCIELGCGKGWFVAQMGLLHPEINYLGIDLTTAVLASASKKIREAYEGEAVPNVRITAYDIGRLPDMMGPADTVEKIYINFCNPWPKDKHKKRRLTHPKQLALYKEVLRPGGEIHFKTDDDMLFAESTAYFRDDPDFEIGFITENLHGQTGIESPMTEHEKMFTQQGICTKYIRIIYKR